MEIKMGKPCNCRFVLQALSFIILLLLRNLQTLFYETLLLEVLVGHQSADAKAAAEEIMFY